MTPVTPDTDAPTADADNVAPIQPAMAKQGSAVGIALRQARSAKNKSIEQAAARLRIKATFLTAIEAGDSEALPGLTYALGFVRSYAEFLDLDPNEIVQDYKREIEDIAQPTDLSFPVPTPTGSQFPGIQVAVISTALLLAGLAGWYVTQADTLFVAAGIATPPGLTSADLRIVTDTNGRSSAPPPRPTPHIATTLLDLTRPAPSSPLPSAPAQVAASKNRPAAPASTEQIPWPAYVLPTEVIATLKVRPTPAEAPPPTPRARPEPPLVVEPTGDSGADQLTASEPDAAEAPPVRTPAVPRQIARADQVPSEPAAQADESPTAANLPIADDPVPTRVFEPARVSESGVDDEASAGQIAAVVGRITPTQTTPPSSDMQAATETAAAESAIANTARLPQIPRTADKPAVGGHTYGQANRDARIVIAAEADIWIQIRDADQNNLFTRLLHAGDLYQVPNRAGLLLFTGNAGGLKLTVDGKPVASLGAAGAVRRDIALNADRLLANAASR